MNSSSTRAGLAVNDRWEGLAAVRYRDQPPNEFFQPALTHHALVQFIRSPDEFELQCDGVNRSVPVRPGSILLVPAGSAARWRWSNHSDSLHVFLDPSLVARVTAEAFEMDPARVSLPPLDGVWLPQLRATMLAVNDELTISAAGGKLAAESLANLLAVQLIRYAAAPRSLSRRTDGALPRTKLRAVVAYVEEHLNAALTLEELAAVAHLSTYHFARQFKAATGAAPHQYIIARRVERAQRLLQHNSDLSLSEVAERTGFSDQSHFTNHFRRLVGLTPSHFRSSARAS